MAQQEATRETTIDMQQMRAVRQQERRKLNQLVKRRRMTQRMLVENEGVLTAINELDDKKETDAIIPLGAGILAMGRILPSALKRTLPGNVVVESTREEIQADLAQRKKILMEDAKILDREIETVDSNIEKMEYMFQVLKQKLANQRRQK